MSAASFPRCKTCSHWKIDAGNDPVVYLEKVERRCCHQWLRGYNTEPPPLDGALVESDEGWAAITGPDFGCVQHSELVGAK